MAKAQGVSKATVQRIWFAYGLQPHRTKRFKLSKDRRFTEKLNDVVGLYLNPPEKAMILCVDEKSQIQALQRTQPGLPMKKGRCGTMTHDYKQHVTTTLFAALNVLDRRVIGECMPRHRHQEFLRFLRRLHREYPKNLDLHLIVNNPASASFSDNHAGSSWSFQSPPVGSASSAMKRLPSLSTTSTLAGVGCREAASKMVNRVVAISISVSPKTPR